MPNELPPPPHSAKMGCLPRLTSPGEFLPILGDVETAPLVPRHKLSDMDLSPNDSPALNQGNQSSCTCASLASALQHVRNTMNGANILPSWATLYGPSNGGRDSGSAIDTALAHLMRVGICPQQIDGEPYIDPFDWKGYYNGSWPDDWQTQARNLRLLEGWDCPSVDHVLSAMYHGFVSVIGVFWPGGGGHAIKLVGYDKTNKRLRLQNTWSQAWGHRGYGWLDESVCAKGIPYFGAFTLRAASWHPLDPAPPLPTPSL